eukprot:TRINITY_DN2574_c1_g1_i8.p1 TRINITY_DN2574_c1_g1~~TRINITY_DN2574_c1_g1_i8.p1  ORF type:complete len:449 (+),score=105.93 TRINITY_DN2574_c1_g1_i8:28-1374(+)
MAVNWVAFELQIVAVVLLYFVFFVGAMLPVRLTRCFTTPQSQATFLSFANCLGAGVLLGASYVHLMSDAEAGKKTDDRVDHLLVAVGFLASFILEKVVFSGEHGHGHGGGGHGHGHADHGADDEDHHNHSHHTHTHKDEHGNEYTEMSVMPGTPNTPGGSKLLKFQHASPVARKMEVLSGSGVSGSTKHDSDDDDINPFGDLNAGTTTSLMVSDDKAHQSDIELDSDHHHTKHHPDGHAHQRHSHKHDEQQLGETDLEARAALTQPIPEHSDTGGELLHTVELKASKEPKFPYILYSVLGLESAISGSALGFQSTPKDVLIIFLAISTHAWAEAFALAAAMLKGRMKEGSVIKWMALYSAITPLCVLGGIGLAQVLQEDSVEVVSSFLIAFAAGTFIYIANMEIMTEEFADKHRKFTKLAFLLGGFLFMAVLGFVLVAITAQTSVGCR